MWIGVVTYYSISIKWLRSFSYSILPTFFPPGRPSVAVHLSFLVLAHYTGRQPFLAAYFAFFLALYRAAYGSLFSFIALYGVPVKPSARFILHHIIPSTAFWSAQASRDRIIDWHVQASKVTGVEGLFLDLPRHMLSLLLLDLGLCRPLLLFTSYIWSLSRTWYTDSFFTLLYSTRTSYLLPSFFLVSGHISFLSSQISQNRTEQRSDKRAVYCTIHTYIYNMHDA